MDVTQFLYVLPLTEDIEIVAPLPKGSPRLVVPQVHLQNILPLLAASSCDALLQDLNRQSDAPRLRFADQQVKLLGHYYVAPDDKVEFTPYFFQNLEKQVTPPG